MTRRALICLLSVLTAVLGLAATPAAAASVVNLYPGQSLQNVLLNASDGDTIVLHQGAYEAVSIGSKTYASGVTVRSAPGEHATIASVWMLDLHGMTFQDVDVAGAFQARLSSSLHILDSHIGGGISIRDDMHDVTISGNRIDGGTFGIWVWNSQVTPRNHDITITSNDISGQTADNIQLGAADNFTITDNALHDLADNADHNDGIQVMGTTGGLIARNRFWNQDQAVMLKAETYLGPGNQVANVTVTNNVVHDERGAGIIVAGTVNTSIVNNTGFDNVFADIHTEPTNANIRIWNNVVHQIWKGDLANITYEDYNCGADIWQHGPHDVVAEPVFTDRASYQLSSSSPCLGAATATGAPSDDVSRSLRTGYVTAGAWQSSTSPSKLAPPAQNAPAPGGSSSVAPKAEGYWLARADARVEAYGGAASLGANGLSLSAPVVGMAPTASGNGFWLVASDGGIFAYGDAPFLGSTGGMHLNAPIVGMTAAPVGRGYWFVAADGGVFAYGDAPFYGSTGSIRLNKPIVGMSAAPDGKGYWFTASDGGVFAYGSAKFYGSTGSIALARPVTAMAPTSTGRGYWLVADDGGIFAFGDAAFSGSGAGRPGSRVVTAAPSA